LESFLDCEILVPAGNIEKLKIACLYGANAVYLGGQQFGLRAAADNFTDEELAEAVEFAHTRDCKVYVVLNSFLHDKDLEMLPDFLKLIDLLKVDAVIVSDLGVVKTVHAHSKVPVHLSTQASCLNVEAAKLWKKMGVTRVILGRECSVYDGGKIKRETGLEVEMFIHGSMCMAYSGNCTISNFTQGRDSNRGGCAHSCRFEYSVSFKDKPKSTNFFMSSKDLNGVGQLPEFLDQGIDSIKVEGRMKSHLYAGTMAKIYREALDCLQSKQTLSSEKMSYWQEELSKVTHRAYSEANLVEVAGSSTIFNEREHADSDYKIVGHVQHVNTDSIIISVRNAFETTNILELLPFKGESQEFSIDWINSLDGTEIHRTKPSTLVRVARPKNCEQFNLLRMRCQQ
jgi:U32 family peptidase